MGVIPPPVMDRPSRSACSVFIVIAGVCALLVLAGGVAMALLGYSRLDAPPATAAAAAARAAETLAAQQAAMETYRTGASEALEADFDYEAALRRWPVARDDNLRQFVRAVLTHPQGFNDDQWIAFAEQARASDDWPDSIDPGRHNTAALIANTAAWLLEDPQWRAILASIDHDLAWRLRDPLTEEYEYDDAYLRGVSSVFHGIALAGLAAARAGQRAQAWENLERMTDLTRQVMREPDVLTGRLAVEVQFHGDIILWALLDQGPLQDHERPRYEAIRGHRSDTAPLKAILESEAALAPGRQQATGFFPRLARRVLFDRFWGIQQDLLQAFDTPPHEVIEALKKDYLAIPVYADETDTRLSQNLYLYRVHWQSRFCWELEELAATLKAWKEARGDYPAALDELVEDGSLDAVPIDPVWGDPLRYARLGDGFALYMLRVEGWYWLYDYWMDEADPNQWELDYGLDWEVVWRALR